MCGVSARTGARAMGAQRVGGGDFDSSVGAGGGVGTGRAGGRGEWDSRKCAENLRLASAVVFPKIGL